MSAPPVWLGADHNSDAWPTPPTALSDVGVEGAVGAGVSNVERAYNNKLGELAPGFVTLSGVATLNMRCAIWAGVAPGSICNHSAAAPATCGAAIDVPDIVRVELDEVMPTERMLTPGAKTSTHDP